MKKTVALLLALVFVFSFAGCDSGEKDARAVVDGFMAAYSVFDMETANTYLDKDVTGLSDVSLDSDDFVSGMPAEFNAYLDDIKAPCDDFINRAKSCISYEITSVEKADDGSFVFTLDTTLPDLDNDAMVSTFAEAFSEDAMSALLSKYITSGQITASSTEQDVIDIIAPDFIALIKDAFDKVEIGTTTAETKMVVVQNDSNWIIDTEKSELDAL